MYVGGGDGGEMGGIEAERTGNVIDLPLL